MPKTYVSEYTDVCNYPFYFIIFLKLFKILVMPLRLTWNNESQPWIGYYVVNQNAFCQAFCIGVNGNLCSFTSTYTKSCRPFAIFFNNLWKMAPHQINVAYCFFLCINYESDR